MLGAVFALLIYFISPEHLFGAAASLLNALLVYLGSMPYLLAPYCWCCCDEKEKENKRLYENELPLVQGGKYVSRLAIKNRQREREREL